MRRAHPIKRRDQHERNARKDRHEEARDQSHVVIKRKPRNENVIIGETKRARVRLKLIQHRLMRKRNAFLQTRCAR